MRTPGYDTAAPGYPELIWTKLQPPRLGTDLINRPHLIDRLNQGTDRKLTLITAQAGAGKTTLLAQWLAKSPLPSAWLSVDETDNNLMIFVSYLCAAIRTVFPDACQQALDLLNAPVLPPPRVLTTLLVNELDALCSSPHFSNGEANRALDLIIALDDYHTIKEPTVHAFLADLLAYLPQCVHLAVSTRIDPPLPLAGLRARGEMSELRTRTLQLDKEEAGLVLELALGQQLGSDIIDLFWEKTEGWVVGMRLAALSIRDLSEYDSLKERLEESNSSFVVDYLMSEVLVNQSPAVQGFLLRSSILDRFNAELCDAVLWPGEDTSSPTRQPGITPSTEMIDELLSANLFLVPLDQEQKWYRYHHLFRDLLRHRLRKQHDQEQIRILHSLASRWFEENGLTEEALTHAFLAGQIDQAAKIVSRQRYTLLNRARWQQLGFYLQHFPPQYVLANPDLAMLKTWLIYHQGHYDQLPAALEQVEVALARVDIAPEKILHLKAEISTARSLVAITGANIKQTITEAEFSLQNTAPELWIVRSLGRVTLAAAYQARGELSRAYETVYGGIDEEVNQSNRLKATTYLTACNIHWIAADMPGLLAAASSCIELSDRSHMEQIKRGARHHLGCVHYLQNDLEAAENQFTEVIQKRYLNYGDFFAYSAFGLSLIHQARNQPEDANQVAELVVAHMLETSNMTLLAVANAFRAELALRQGDLSTATRWAEQFKSTPPMGLMYRFYEPRLTLVKTWLAEATNSSRRRAAEYLGQLRSFAEATNNRIVLIAVLALSAMVHAADDDEPAALDALIKALVLAEPGRLIRVFADQEPPMAQLCQKLYEQRETAGYLIPYLAQILEAYDELGLSQDQFNPSRGPALTPTLIEPLTSREMEVLTLLAQRLTNKEIAKKLVISPGTVKTHTLNIYSKLAVNGRHQAADRARELGLLKQN